MEMTLQRQGAHHLNSLASLLSTLRSWFAFNSPNYQLGTCHAASRLTELRESSETGIHEPWHYRAIMASFINENVNDESHDTMQTTNSSQVNTPRFVIQAMRD
ncbi:hypothetical protein KIN20_008990 [Parelaphostrongylus tenuis]|uniref:Uncharacterized protein n=1 Tax=Parelaphostrongylus tenuis TaxID=148309 RepID=A0AAD5M8S9_PARTN|nr:hypothetical protein KIN20_008990 [Parelaphostrongylus tenuis]